MLGYKHTVEAIEKMKEYYKDKKKTSYVWQKSY